MAKINKTKNIKQLRVKDVVVRNYYRQQSIENLIQNRKIINTLIKRKRIIDALRKVKKKKKKQKCDTLMML